MGGRRSDPAGGGVSLLSNNYISRYLLPMCGVVWQVRCARVGLIQDSLGLELIVMTLLHLKHKGVAPRRAYKYTFMRSLIIVVGERISRGVTWRGRQRHTRRRYGKANQDGRRGIPSRCHN